MEKILDFFGKEVIGADGNIFTYQNVMVSSLLAPEPKDDHEMKMRKYKIAQKVHDHKDLDQIDKELIKEQVSKYFGPLVIGRIYEKLYGSINDNI